MSVQLAMHARRGLYSGDNTSVHLALMQCTVYFPGTSVTCASCSWLQPVCFDVLSACFDVLSPSIISEIPVFDFELNLGECDWKYNAAFLRVGLAIACMDFLSAIADLRRAFRVPLMVTSSTKYVPFTTNASKSLKYCDFLKSLNLSRLSSLMASFSASVKRVVSMFPCRMAISIFSFVLPLMLTCCGAPLRMYSWYMIRACVISCLDCLSLRIRGIPSNSPVRGGIDPTLFRVAISFNSLVSLGVKVEPEPSSAEWFNRRSLATFRLLSFKDSIWFPFFDCVGVYLIAVVST
mmetsp:Transcript_16377/g.40375  ORF Transcript_16377/g.40375 Transcript_16377/m.40375 type:complete len:293 (+) Transcript_16377:79-957(+)